MFDYRHILEHSRLFASKLYGLVRMDTFSFDSVVQNRVLSHEYPQQIPDHLFCTSRWTFGLSLATPNLHHHQSGQSLIEHSYKADSDLSPAGWEYAERLKDFVLDRRAKSLEQRGLNPKDRKLVVYIYPSSNNTTVDSNPQ